MKKPNQKRENQKGQALAEMTIGLIAICFVFIGVLVVGDMSINSIRNFLKARENADESLDDALLPLDGTSIAQVTAGNDGLMFTYDDEIIDYNAVADIDGDGIPDSIPSTILGEIQTPEGVTMTYAFPDHVMSSSQDSLFLNAANLTLSYSTRSLPSDSEEVSQDMLTFLFGNPVTLTIRDEVYMPDSNQ